MRWLGASMRFTGMTGACDIVAVDDVSGTSGKGDLVMESTLGSGLLWPLPGVAGHEDRRRGVPFMA